MCGSVFWIKSKARWWGDQLLREYCISLPAICVPVLPELLRLVSIGDEGVAIRQRDERGLGTGKWTNGGSLSKEWVLAICSASKLLTAR